jgi:predicted oxidoreductase
MPPGNFGDNSPFDSDFALIGTGVAPLVAASSLISQGKSVLVLNPDFFFFF